MQRMVAVSNQIVAAPPASRDWSSVLKISSRGTRRMTGFRSFCGRKSGQYPPPGREQHLTITDLLVPRKSPPELSPAVSPPLQHSSNTSSEKRLRYSPRKQEEDRRIVLGAQQGQSHTPRGIQVDVGRGPAQQTFFKQPAGNMTVSKTQASKPFRGKAV